MKKLSLVLLVVVYTSTLCGSIPMTKITQATSPLTLTSGNQELNDGFLWAKNLALSYVATGRSGVPYPCYQGSYANDPQFCARDISHQIEAGHLLGLDNENFYMLKAFAQEANINPDNCRLHWPYWKIDFAGNGSFFTPELPTPFELAQKAIDQYIWTANAQWINDPVLKTYYSYTNTNLVSYLDSDNNGVVDIGKLQTNCHDGLSSYWEFPNNPSFESGDALGCQYQSYLSYAKYLTYSGASATDIANFQNKAATLKDWFNNHWFSSSANRFMSGTTLHGGHTPLTDWAHEQSIFILLKELPSVGLNRTNYINFVQGNVYNQGINIEATTYLSEAFYKQHANNLGWHWLLYDLRSRDVYPEVSYLAIRNIVCGLMGLTPDAPNGKVTTLSHLVNDIPWVEINHIPVGVNDLKIKHVGKTSSALTNNSTATIQWEAQFYGNYSTVLVNGVSMPSSVKTVDGELVSTVIVPVTSGQTSTASVTPTSDYVYLSDIPYATVSTAANLHLDNCASGYALTLKDSDPLNKTYKKGLGVKDNQTITYNLNGNYKFFTAKLGVDIAKGAQSQQYGKATYSVVADGTTIYTSTAMDYNSTPVIINLSMVNVQTLKLVTTTTGSTYPDWIDAKLFTQPIASFVATAPIEQVVAPGSSSSLVLHITNNSPFASANPVNVTCELVGTNGQNITINNPSESLPAIGANTSVDKSFGFTLAPGLPAATRFCLKFTITDGVSMCECYSQLVTPYPVMTMNYLSIQDRSTTVVADNLFNAGDTGNATFTITNSGSGDSGPLLLTTAATNGSSYVTFPSPSISIANIPANSSITQKVPIAINAAAQPGQSFTFSYQLTQLSDNSIIASIDKNYSISKPDFTITYQGLTNSVAQYPILYQGTIATATVQIKNIGTKNGVGGTLNLSKTENNQSVYTLPQNSVTVPAINVGQTANVSFPVSLNAGVADNTVISVTNSYVEGTITKSIITRFVSGKVYCSDMPIASETVGYASAARDMNVFNSSLIKIAGNTYNKGFGCHATSTLVFDLAGRYLQFSTDAGLQQDAAGTCSFQVFLDGTKKWDSNTLSGNVKGTTNLDVTNVQQLKLVITDGGDGISSDHGDWGNTCLVPKINISGMTDVNLDELFSVYPTKCKIGDKIRIRSNLPSSTISLHLTDLRGLQIMREFKQSISGTNEFTFTTDGLEKGMYLLRILDNKKINKSYKIIID